MDKKIGNSLHLCSFGQYTIGHSSRVYYELSDDANGENIVAKIKVCYHNNGTKRVKLESVDLLNVEQVKDIYDFMVKLENE